MAIEASDLVISTNPSLRSYGVGRVLMVKNGIAKVEYSPGLFSDPPLYAHTKLLILLCGSGFKGKTTRSFYLVCTPYS